MYVLTCIDIFQRCEHHVLDHSAKHHNRHAVYVKMSSMAVWYVNISTSVMYPIYPNNRSIKLFCCCCVESEDACFIRVTNSAILYVYKWIYVSDQIYMPS